MLSNIEFDLEIFGGCSDFDVLAPFYHLTYLYLIAEFLFCFVFYPLYTKLLEEMKRHGVKLKGETYICLLNACAATGRTDKVYVVLVIGYGLVLYLIL